MPSGVLLVMNRSAGPFEMLGEFPCCELEAMLINVSRINEDKGHLAYRTGCLRRACHGVVCQPQIPYLGYDATGIRIKG